jgi:hypothetical protein
MPLVDLGNVADGTSMTITEIRSKIYRCFSDGSPHCLLRPVVMTFI